MHTRITASMQCSSVRADLLIVPHAVSQPPRRTSAESYPRKRIIDVRNTSAMCKMMKRT
jgi:hypothetical protein